MAVPLIIGGVALAVSLLDRLSAFQDKSDETIRRSEGFVQSPLIPLVALVGGGILLYQAIQTTRRGK